MPINFYLENRASKNGDTPIRVSISIFSLRFVTSIGYSINPTKWDNEKQKVKHGSRNYRGITYSTINAKLNAIDSLFIDYENYLLSSKKDITIGGVKNVWTSNFGKIKNDHIQFEYHEKTLLNYYDAFITENGVTNNWTDATYKKLKAVRSHISGFVPKPTFENFNKEGLTDYIVYLKDDKNMRNSTIAKQLGFLKWFLKWSTEKKYNKNRDYETFRPRLKTSERKIIFLTWEELIKVYHFDLSQNKNYLNRVRDVFCFCCFTSLRYSDVYNLKRSNIIGNTLQFTTVKTSDSLTIDLNKYSKAILTKYSKMPNQEDKALPVISNQKMNDYLKELGNVCGISEPQTVIYFKGNKRIEKVHPKHELLSTHTGRRTFICNALALGIPAHVVMKWTGHSDYKAMKPYIDIADNTKTLAMAKFNEL